MRLEAGGVGVAVPRRLLLTPVHLHPKYTLRAVARRRGAGTGCTVGVSRRHMSLAAAYFLKSENTLVS
jgi:hypothetical protein